MSQPKLRVLVAILIGNFTFLPSAFSQGLTGQISGTVMDSSGSVIVGAAVHLTNTGTGQSRASISDSQGNFLFPDLLAGTYDVSIAQPGFKTYSERNIELSSQERRALQPFRLEVGELSTSVTVEARTVRVATESSERIGTIEQTRIENLPLTTDRMNQGYLSTLKLLPGVVGNTVNGGANGQFIVTLDGITSADTGVQGTGSQVLSPNPDTISEVKVALTNYQAEYGVRSGGTISVVTKAGGREFHGTGYLYLRNEAFNANSFFNNANLVNLGPDGKARRSIYRYTEPGYTVGGPLLVPGTGFNRSHNKLFFFWSQEWVLQKPPFSVSQYRMPTAAEFNGDFSQSYDTNGRLIPIYDPTQGKAVQFPANYVNPALYFNPNMVKMLKLFPYSTNLINGPNPGGLSSNYQYNWQNTFYSHPHRDQDLLRLDWNVGRKTLLYARFLRDYTGTEAQQGGWNQMYALNATPAFGVVATWIQTFRPNLVNELTSGYNTTRQWLAFDDSQITKNTRSANSITLPQLYSVNVQNLLPTATFGVPGLSPAFSFPDAQRFPFRARDTLRNLSDNLSWIRGSHNFKFGFYTEFTDRNAPKESFFEGTYNFASAGQSTMPLDTNYGYANALMGNFQSYEESDSKIRAYSRYHDLEWFAQDNWKVSRRLTLDVGLRLQLIQPSWNLGNTLYNWERSSYSLNQAPALLWYTCQNVGNPCSGANRVLIDPSTKQAVGSAYAGSLVAGSGVFYQGVQKYYEHLMNTPPLGIGPRAGFAWDLFGDGKMAVRGGFGMFYDRSGGDDFVAFALESSPYFNNNLFYYSTVSALAGGSVSGVAFPTGTYNAQRNFSTPSSYNWSIGVQRDVGFNTIIDVSYVGTAGRHLRTSGTGPDINAAGPGTNRLQSSCDPTTTTSGQTPVLALGQSAASTCSLMPANFLRPVRGFATINSVGFYLSSNYHALQAQVNRRFSHGLQINANYTWSKAMQYSGGGLSPFYPARMQYGLGGNDRLHNLNVNYVYRLPFDRLTSNAVARVVVGGWQVSGYTSFVSGAPLSMTFSQYVNGTSGQTVDFTGQVGGIAITRVNVNGSPTTSDAPKFRTQSPLSITAFAPPSISSNGIGSAGTTIFRGPGLNNWDMSVNRVFKLKWFDRYHGEAGSLEFRADAFNAFNHTQFNGVSTAAQFSSAGVLLNGWNNATAQNPTIGFFGDYTGTTSPRTMMLSIRVRF